MGNGKLDRKLIVCIVGTRPEAIKMAPVISVLRASDWAECIVISTAQHRSLVDLTGRMIPALSKAIAELSPYAVLSQGDTATVFGAAVVAYYLKIPFGHVEAGLRTNNLQQPFPEEGLRQMVARVVRWHFAPT